MFYQYNPNAAVWGDMHWAHATSPDMVRWEHKPVAIAPTPGGFDRDGVFSGSAVLDNGKPTIIYTGVLPPASDAEATLRDGHHTWREVQCLAVAEDEDLRTWKKLPEPIIVAPPAGLDVVGFRDPCLWREGDFWMLALGSGIRNKGGMVLLYRSTDLRRWTYLHPLVNGPASDQKSVNPVDTGDMWECPDFFPLGHKHVLLISTKGKVLWKVGTYKDQRFSPEKEGVVDWGSYYAAKTMLDRHGNRILWGWIPETRPEAEFSAAGWAGVMALPRILSLTAENELQMEVAAEVESLRVRNHHALMNPTIREPSLSAMRIRDLSAEMLMTLNPGHPFSLTLRSDNGEEFATVRLTNASGKRQLQMNDLKAPLAGRPDAPVRLRIYLDGSVMEAFADGTTVITARIYRAPSGPLRLEFENPSGLADVRVWQLHPISKDRMTGSLCD